MKNRNKLFTSIAILGSAIFGMILTAGTGVFETLGLFGSRATANGTFALNFNNKKNAYLGKGSQIMLTENGGAVNFSFTNCAKLTGGFLTVNSGGSFCNSEQITSINKVNVVYTASTGATLKFKASLDKTHWGEYVTIASNADFVLDSHPYYLEFTADGGSVNIESLNISFLCSPNPNAEKVVGDSYFRLKENFDEEENISGTYLIVGDARDNTSVALDGSITDNFDVNNNTYPVTINSDNTIDYTEELAKRTFDIQKYGVASDGYNQYSVKSKSGVYIGTKSAKTIQTSSNPEYFDNEFWYGSDEDTHGDTEFLKFYGDGYYLRFNYDNNATPTNRFRFYDSKAMHDIYLYQLIGEGGGVTPTPVYEAGIIRTSTKTSFTVDQSFNDYIDVDGGLKVAVSMSDSTSKPLTSNKYTIVIRDNLGNEINGSERFPHTGVYSVTISYGALLPITYDITVSNFETAVTAFKTTTSYDVNDAIDLSDVTAKIDYFIDEDNEFVSYANFGANNLTATLKDPNGNTVSTSGTFNKAGTWHLIVSVASNPSISTTIDIDVAVISVASITLDKPTASMFIGDTTTVTPTILPTNATDTSVTWTSSNSSIASVSGGTITAHSEGTATITAKAGNCTATCDVTVYPVSVTGVAVASIGNMNIGDERNLSVTISPANATNKAVSYSTNPAGIVNVTADGKVTAIAAGTTVITVTTADGGFTATTSTTVSAVNVSSVSLDNTSLELSVSDSPATLTATVLPTNATNKALIWESSDNSVATVSGSNNTASVSPLGEGTATITAKSVSDNTKYAECEVTVSATSEWVLVEDENDLVVGKKYVFAYEDGNVTMGSLNTSGTNPYFEVVSSTFDTTNDKITALSTSTIPYTLGKQDNHYTFTNGLNVLSSPATKQLSHNNGTTTWDISFYGSTSYIVISSTDSTPNTIFYNGNNGSIRFASYNNQTHGSNHFSYPQLFMQTGGGVTPEKELTEITISGQTLSFTQGDTFNFGGTVTAHFDDGSTEDVTSSASFGGYSMSAVGTQTVIVSYMGQTAEYEITVSSRVVTLQSISVSGQKVSFNVGDTFSFGGIVTGLYSDSSHRDVTSSATFNGYNMSQAGRQTVTVTVNSVSTTYQITVIASSPISIAEDMTINPAIFGNNTGYSACAGSYNISENNTYNVTINRVCQQDGQVQFSSPSNKNGGGSIYNTTSLPLAKITISPASACSDIVIYVGNEEKPTQTEVLQQNGEYIFGGESYFRIVTTTTVKVDSIVISVGAPEPVNPNGITISKSSTSIAIGETEKLTYSLLPTNCNQNKGVRWSSSNEAVATVDQNGNVKGISKGDATVKVESTFNDALYQTCSVHVSEVKVSSISVAPSTKTLELNETIQLSATVLPANATNSNVTWSTSNNKVTVSSTGLVTAKSVGTAIVTATANDGSGVKGTCSITIVEEHATEDDEWTILIYMCGADLESGWDDDTKSYADDTYYASVDLDEIKSVTGQPDDVNIVIEAGGSKRWSPTYSSLINTKNLNRFHLENNNYVLDERVSKASMGKSSTLSSFVSWGMQKYPAEKTALIFWNHGGAMGGVCSDENYDGDSLLNSEVSSALSTALGSKKLEWIGYDACLMAVQDVADFNSVYANYMVCSEESEAGYGWDYDTWIDDVFDHENTTTILTSIVDGFIADTNRLYRQNNWGTSDQTLSWLDLSQMANYRSKFETFATQLLNKLSNVNKQTFSNWVIRNVKHFAENDYDYFALFDAYDFVSKIKSNSSYNPGGTYAQDVLTAFNSVVKYSNKGSGAGNAYGLGLIFANTEADPNYYSVSDFYLSIETNFENWRDLNLSKGYLVDYD